MAMQKGIVQVEEVDGGGVIITQKQAPANGSGPSQQIYPGSGGFPLPTYNLVNPLRQHQLPHSSPPPPHIYHKDERALRQHTKLMRKLEIKQNSYQRNNGLELISGSSTPSPRKDMVNGSGGSSGNGSSAACWSEGESSSATPSVQDQEDITQTLLDMLSAARTPNVSELTPVSALVQWNNPLPPGLTLPKGEVTYELLLGDKGRGRYKAIYSGKSLSCRVRDLHPGSEYSVCLQVRCGSITSGASDAASFRAPAAPPGPPPAPRATLKARYQIMLRWAAAPECGSRIIYYIIEMDNGEGWIEISRPRARQYVTNDLKPLTCHQFRIAAVNECGQGPWSDTSVAWTAGAPPPAPHSPRVIAVHSSSVALEWESAPISEEFTLQMADETNNHGFRPVYSGQDSQYLCEGLRRATLYRFRLRRESLDGVGPWSSETTTRTLPERPSPPGRPQPKGKIHSRAFRLRWDPPTDDGGSPVSSYTVELDGGTGFSPMYSGLDREAHCERLEPGSKYRPRVNCTAVGGVSDWILGDTITTEAVQPAQCPPPELVNEPKPRSASVRWEPPDTNGGAEITSYRLELNDMIVNPSILYEGLDQHFNIQDLEPGYTYEISVAAFNRIGSGPPSTPIRFKTAPAPPDVPETPIVEIMNPHSAVIRWQEPNGNGAPILEYHLEMSQVDTDAMNYREIYRGPHLEHIAAVTPFTPYSFRVSARGPAGKGPHSPATAVLTPAAPPAPPLALRHQATSTSMRLLWRQPPDHGSSITKYILQVDNSKYETSETEYVIKELEPNTTYCVSVSAVNELGCGDVIVAHLTTRPAPPSPPKLECVQRTHHFLKLQWGEGKTCDEVQYRLEMRGPESREFRIIYRGLQNSFKAKKLKESTTYHFRIAATDERGGRGEFSETCDFSTCASPPLPPKKLHIEPVGSRCIAVNWESQPEHEYVVQWCRSRDTQPQSMRTEPGVSHIRLEDLEAACEYWVRVCSARGVMVGVWSPQVNVIPTAATHAVALTKVRRPRSAPRLVERYAALLIASALVLLAVLVAFGVERYVQYREP